MRDLAGLNDLLGDYLARQRWYAGDHAPDTVEVVHDEWLVPRLRWMIVRADGVFYQLTLGTCAGLETPEFLHGSETAIVGIVDDQIVFDAVLDHELACALLERVTDGAEKAETFRPIGVEQSNSSLVFDERIMLKLFRRLQRGRNPDVEVTTGLGNVGFEHVPKTLAVWSEDQFDLAIAQEFLHSATEGWSLALTSLRDLFGADSDDPSEQGGDFSGEAERLGSVTAQMHVALASAFGSAEGDAPSWSLKMKEQLDDVVSGEPWREAAARVFARYGESRNSGRSLRVHGDYHLGQTVRADTGWYVLDFEGEPARPLAERTAPTSPLKDVAGMLRSLHYATQVALREREEHETEALQARARAWEELNREAFLEGYLSVPGVHGLLPEGEEAIRLAISAWELDKAVYELAYERAYRPDWTEIPEAAITRLLQTVR